jgi:hypothetical protein
VCYGYRIHVLLRRVSRDLGRAYVGQTSRPTMLHTGLNLLVLQKRTKHLAPSTVVRYCPKADVVRWRMRISKLEIVYDDLKESGVSVTTADERLGDNPARIDAKKFASAFASPAAQTHFLQTLVPQRSACDGKRRDSIRPRGHTGGVRPIVLAVGNGRTPESNGSYKYW